MTLELISEYRFFIATGKSDYVLSELSQNDNPLRNENIMLFNAYNRLSREKMTGIITSTEYETRINQINFNLLNHLELLEKHYSPVKNLVPQDSILPDIASNINFNDFVYLDKVSNYEDVRDKIINGDQFLINCDELKNVITENLYNSFLKTINDLRLLDNNISVESNEEIASNFDKILEYLALNDVSIFGTVEKCMLR